jgi:hypothetical protein
MKFNTLKDTPTGLDRMDKKNANKNNKKNGKTRAQQ